MKYFLFLVLITAPMIVFAQAIPKGCDEAQLIKDGADKARLQKAIEITGSGVVDPGLQPSSKEKGISPRDLQKVIIYFDPIKKSCSFIKLAETPFGRWVKTELDWRKLQKLKPSDLSNRPVEVDGAYTAKYWRTLPLMAQANLFDLRAANGYKAIMEGASTCKLKSGKTNAQKLNDFAEDFNKFYNAKLSDQKN